MAKKDSKPEQHLAPKILTLKVKNDGLQIKYLDRVVMSDGKEVPNLFNGTIRHEPHMDLKVCVDKLVPHLAMLSDYEPTKGFEVSTDAKIAEILDRYKVRHIAFLEAEGVVNGVRLGGYRKLNRGGAPSNMLLPKVMFQAEGEKYEYADQLEEIVSALVGEVVAYLGGKRADPGQITFNFTAPAEGEEGSEEGGE